MESFKFAEEIVQKLSREGYKAYFAGGWVRDYLMGHPSDDVDIATDAPPEKILDLFPRTILVGLAFGVVVVSVNGHQFEVATFRRDVDYVNGRKPQKIEFSTPEEDAARRDFTINGMFYDPLEKQVYDFVSGQEDIKNKLIRAIGNPYERFVEDRLRMIRAVRFAARFGFVIDEDTKEAIRASADTLFPSVAMERIWQEFGKMVKYAGVDLAFVELHRLGLLPVIFPKLTGIHLNDIKTMVAPFHHFSKDVDPIVYILHLFPNITHEESEDLCSYLKVSRYEMSLARVFVELRNRVADEVVLKVVDWCYWAIFYAHPSSEKFVHVIAASMDPQKAALFVDLHRARRKKLAVHTKRAAEKTPLISSMRLVNEGIAPGKLMGILMKEGERLAILNDVRSEDDAMAILKQSSLWPKKEIL